MHGSLNPETREFTVSYRRRSGLFFKSKKSRLASGCEGSLRRGSVARDGNGEGLGKCSAVLHMAGEEEPGDAAIRAWLDPEAGGCGFDSPLNQRPEVLIPCPSVSLP